jgi:DNA-binding NarL/FixJ family response regulator
MVAESLSLLLSQINWIEVSGIVNNGWQVLDFVKDNEVDIVLADFQMPLLNGIETTIKLRALYPKIKVLMITMKEDAESIKNAIQAGVDGYLMKKNSKEVLEKAILRVIEGDKFFSNDVITVLSAVPNPDNASGKSEVEDSKTISVREFEIIKLIISELSNPEIAEKLNIALSTVTTHRQNIYKKTGVSSAVGLLKWAIKNGLIDEDDIEL